MRRDAFLGRTTVVAVVVILLLAGCSGTPRQGTAAPESSPSTPAETPTTPITPSETPTTPTETPTTLATSTTAPLESLPSPANCLTDATPNPESVDGVDPASYPEPPTNTSRPAVVAWVQSFETAYFRNDILAGAGDDNMTLTSVSASAEVRAVNRTAEGYTVRLSDFGASNYASGIHGDHWTDVGYVVTETQLVRVPLEDRNSEVEAEAGTPVVDCR